MDVIDLTRRLVDIESISGNEGTLGELLFNELSALGFQTTKMPVETGRFNIYASAQSTSPQIVFSTHMDTVPPFFPSSEDDQNIYGRGACQHSPGCRFMIDGEPTENRMAVASKGALRVKLRATGKMAHSAYPELGESAIEKLLEALNRLRTIQLPRDPEIGATTVNIGIIEGGRAPNIVPDSASAQLLYRLIGASSILKQQITAAVRELAGPGSIQVAHTEGEYVQKKQLREAVEVYVSIARKLLQ